MQSNDQSRRGHAVPNAKKIFCSFDTSELRRKDFCKISLRTKRYLESIFEKSGFQIFLVAWNASPQYSSMFAKIFDRIVELQKA